MLNPKGSSIEQVIEIFRSSDATKRADFIEACSFTKWAEEALIAAKSNIPEMKANALDFAALGCIQNGSFELGAKLGEAGYRLALEGYTSGTGDKNNYRMIAGRNALNWMNSLQRLGQHEELINRIGEPIVWLSSIGDRDTLGMLLLKRVEAELDLENFDRAERLLQEIDTKALSVFELTSYRSHEYRIVQHKGGGTSLPEEEKAPGPKDLKQVLFGSNFEEEQAPDLKALTKVLSGKEGKKVDDETWKRYLQTSQTYSQYKDVAGKITSSLFGGSDNEFTVRQKITEANYLFMDPKKGRDPTEIKQIIPVLLDGRDWMKQHNLPDSENDAAWGLYLCYNRTNRENLAAEELLRIRSNIEKARSKVVDPIERARLSERYPYLHASLCQMLYKAECNLKEHLEAIESGKARIPADLQTQQYREELLEAIQQYREELLEAIESGKARILADLQTQRSGRPANDRQFTKTIQQLPELMKRLGTHYLTTFVDDDGIYCVIVTNSGEIRSHFVEIERETLEWLASIRDPSKWGTRENLYAPRIPSNVPQQLAPIVKWLWPLYSELGLLKSGDHICYSPHDALLAIPFHYIDFGGKPMVEYFSMSRVHGAHTLAETLRLESTVPDSFSAVQAPSTDDQKDPNKLADFERPINWLKENLAVAGIFKDEEADIIHLGRTFQHQVVHFATHGIFPESPFEKLDPNPYSSSGVVLAANGNLPDLSKLYKSLEKRISCDHLLTPANFLQQGFDFLNSHVTLQACVSGLAKRGYGGDALGLEWALLQLGATSILSTHWDVLAQTTSEFTVRFYNRWLNKRESRASAWRNTMLELRNEPATSNPSHWAAFSLSGNWR